MAAFFASFGTYVIKLIFFAIVAVAGIFVGKKLRDRKDAKTASEESMCHHSSEPAIALNGMPTSPAETAGTLAAESVEEEPPLAEADPAAEPPALPELACPPPEEPDEPALF